MNMMYLFFSRHRCEYHDHGRMVAIVRRYRHFADEDDSKPFPARYGSPIVTGLSLYHPKFVMLMGMSSIPYSTEDAKGTKRTFMVDLDTTQYAMDAEALSSSTKGLSSSMYQMFSLVIRRHAKVNNFRSILETIRGL